MFSRIAFALVALPLAARLAAAQTCSRYYTVQEGDICDSISASNDVSTYQLALVNNNTVNADCSNLVPGEVLCLGWVGEDCTTTTVVQSGDDCDIISTNAGINTTILYYNNPQINDECTNIYIGEVLCTASTVQVPPLPASSLPASTIPATATPANTGTPVNVAPSPSVSSTDDDGDDDDDDCGDDEPEPSSTPSSTVYTSAAATASSTVDDGDDCGDGEPSSSAPSATLIVISSTSSATSSAPSASATNDGDDDDGDIPYCDEVEDDEDFADYIVLW